MRILHTSDWHLGKTLEGRDRSKEQIYVMDEICRIADEEEVDLVLIAGDIYQTVNPPAWAENLFYETIHRLSSFGKRGVVVISGNHDQPERIRAANPLADKQGIYLIGLPDDELRPSIFRNSQLIYTKRVGNGWLEIVLPNEESAIISVLPYPSEARLKRLFSHSSELQDIRKAYSEYIGKWFSSQQEFFGKETVNLAVSHLYIQGGEPSESEIEIQLGGAYTVEPKHIPDWFDYVALGHLHRAQNVKGTSSITRYAGSPLAYSFSEAAHKKSVTIVDVKAGRKSDIKEIHLSSGLPLIKKSIKNGMNELEDWMNNEGNRPSWIDLEIHTEHPLSIEEIQRIRKMHDGIINIRVITSKLKQDEELIEIKSKQPVELFNKFYQYKTGAKPKQEVLSLFNELFHLDSDGEES